LDEAAKKADTIAGGATETHGTHTMTVKVGHSTETMTLGAKVVEALV